MAPRVVCLVHENKPRVCRKLRPADFHGHSPDLEPMGDECYQCGTCCHGNKQVHPGEMADLITAVNAKKAHLMSLNVDAGKAASHIGLRGTTPTRRDTGAGSLKWEGGVLPEDACAMLAPEEKGKRRK